MEAGQKSRRGAALASLSAFWSISACRRLLDGQEKLLDLSFQVSGSSYLCIALIDHRGTASGLLVVKSLNLPGLGVWLPSAGRGRLQRRIMCCHPVLHFRLSRTLSSSTSSNWLALCTSQARVTSSGLLAFQHRPCLDGFVHTT